MIYNKTRQVFITLKIAFRKIEQTAPLENKIDTIVNQMGLEKLF